MSPGNVFERNLAKNAGLSRELGFEVWEISFPRFPNSLSCINQYLAMVSGGNVNELFSRVFLQG